MSRGFPSVALAQQDARRGLSGRALDGVHYVTYRSADGWKWDRKFPALSCDGRPAAIRRCRNMVEHGPGTLQSQQYRCDVCGKGYNDDFGREP